MPYTLNSRAASVGDAVFNASRQLWLAGLGAAVVTRDWAEREAGSALRNLIREGTVVESRAFRVVGDRLDTSFTQANTFWKRARRTVTTTVKAYADTAAMLVRESLPASLPKVVSGTDARASSKPTPKRAAKRTQRTTRRTPAKRAKRTVKTAKRG